MKILKQPPSDWAIKYTCEKCASELEIEKSDVKVTHYDGDFRESPYDHYWCTCPVCNAIIAIPEKTIPSFVKIEMKKKSGII